MRFKIKLHDGNIVLGRKMLPEIKRGGWRISKPAIYVFITAILLDR